MEHNSFIVMVVAACVSVSSVILSFASSASILALSRNPAAAPRIFSGMVIALVAGEAFTVGVMAYMLWAS